MRAVFYDVCYSSIILVPMVALNFSGSTSIWLQSIQHRLGEFDWNSFPTLLCTRFGCDRHQTLIGQFYSIRQTTTVADYIERFEAIINLLNSYSESIHPYYFLTRFVEGLGTDIRAVVMVQCPLIWTRVCPGAAARGGHRIDAASAPAAGHSAR